MRRRTTADREILIDALGAEAAEATAIGRESLGVGTISGFRVRQSTGPDAVFYVDTSGTPVRAETGAARPGARVWMHPADPHLPALAAVAFGGAADMLLRRLGLQPTGAPEIVAYRAGRRAVVRVPAASGDVWVKVLPPQRVERVHALHAALAASGIPVPEVHGWSPEGVLVTASARGVPAPDVEWDPAALLDATDDLRDRFASTPLTNVARTDLLGRLHWYRSRLTDAGAGRAVLLTDDARRAWREDGAVVAVHGDLHFGQLFLDGEAGSIRVSGLVDVDTAGKDDAGADSAAFVAHAVASALLTGDASGNARVWRLAELSRERWVRDAGTRSRTAIHLLGHIIGAVDRGDQAAAAQLVDATDAVLHDRAFARECSPAQVF